MVFRWADCVEHRRRLTVFDLTDSLVTLSRDLLRRATKTTVVQIVACLLRSDPLTPISGAVETLAESTVQTAIERESWIGAHREEPDDD